MEHRHKRSIEAAEQILEHALLGRGQLCRNNDAAGARHTRIREERPYELLQPVRLNLHIIVGEGDELILATAQGTVSGRRNTTFWLVQDLNFVRGHAAYLCMVLFVRHQAIVHQHDFELGVVELSDTGHGDAEALHPPECRGDRHGYPRPRSRLQTGPGSVHRCRQPGGGGHKLVSQRRPAIVEIQFDHSHRSAVAAHQDLDPLGVCVDLLLRIRRQLPVDEVGDEHLRWAPSFDTVPAVAAHTDSFATDRSGAPARWSALLIRLTSLHAGRAAVHRASPRTPLPLLHELHEHFGSHFRSDQEPANAQIASSPERMQPETHLTRTRVSLLPGNPSRPSVVIPEGIGHRGDGSPESLFENPPGLPELVAQGGGGEKVGLKVLVPMTPDLDPGGIEIGQGFKAHHRVLSTVTAKGPFGPAPEVRRRNEDGRFGVKGFDTRCDELPKLSKASSNVK